MGTPTFLDLLLPQLEFPFFTVAIDKQGTGTWDFGHLDNTKYVGQLSTVPVDDNCNTGGSWSVSGVTAQFPEGNMPQINCAGFGEHKCDFGSFDGPCLTSRIYRYRIRPYNARLRDYGTLLSRCPGRRCFNRTIHIPLQCNTTRPCHYNWWKQGCSAWRCDHLPPVRCGSEQ